MDQTKITPTLTEKSKGNVLFTSNKVVDPYPKVIHSTYESLSENKYLPSIFFDTKNLSLIASLSLDSGIVLNESTKSNYSLLPPYSNISASTSSNINVNPFDIVDTVREEFGFKLEKDIVVECDVIDGVVIRSFTTMDDLDQFVASSSALEQAKNLSPHLKKVKRDSPLSPGYCKRDMNRMDAALFVRSEELYYEDYNVPFPSNKRRPVVECNKRFCVLGCICDSLNSSRHLLEHCNHAECMFNRVCSYKQKLKCDFLSPTERHDSQEFYKFSKRALLEELSSTKEEIYFKRMAEMSEKQFEIDHLENEMMGKTVFGSNITLRSSAAKSNTKVKNVKAKEESKAKTKEKFKVEIKEVTGGKRLNAKVEVGDAKMKTRRSLAVDGLQIGSFPFDESILNRLADNTTYSKFVRQLMRKMFTSNFLSSKSLSWMKDEHLAAITDAAMKRFKFYQQKNGEFARVTPELVKKVVTSEFNVRQTKKKRMRY